MAEKRKYAIGTRVLTARDPSEFNGEQVFSAGRIIRYLDGGYYEVTLDSGRKTINPDEKTYVRFKKN